MCEAPGPSINDWPFGQVVHSNIHTSYISFALIEGTDVSSPVSRIARAGTGRLLFFMFACDVDGITSVRAIMPSIIFLFID